MTGIIFTEAISDPLLVGRTQRSLRAAGISRILVCAANELAMALADTDGAVWLLRAGCWQQHPAMMRVIPPSATGRELIGLGNGGPSYYFAGASARAVAERMRRGESLAKAIRKAGRSFRVVPLHDIDVSFSSSPRGIQLVTSIQMGGAERVALDLAREFNCIGWHMAVLATGAPTRRAYAAPPCFIDLSRIAPSLRADAVKQAALDFGADFIHAHLLSADDARAIRSLPLAITIHNTLPIWPEGHMEASAPFADVYFGCAEVVTRQIESQLPSSTAALTVLNGIDPARVAPTPERLNAGAALRASLGWGPGDFVLLSVANARPQKRLDRLPEIVAALQKRIFPRAVRLLLAGEPSAWSPAAKDCMAAFHRAIERWQVAEAVHWTGAVDDVAPLLTAADVLLCVSSREGLSLAQLEALAAGVPVMATDAGGTREIAARSPHLTLLSVEAKAEEFASALVALASSPPPRIPALPPEFTRDAMARRAQLCLNSLLASVSRDDLGPSDCVWMITNNFTTGGAQSSARRLLAALKDKGHEVCAATLEESECRQSHGSAALRAAGVPVLTIHPSRNAADMVSELLVAMASKPPRALFFWNVMPPVKLLLAEMLSLWRREDGTRIPIYDVSPGEMLFHSLDRFLAGKPQADARDYGRRLAGAVVKYESEAARAAAVLGVPVHVIRNGIPECDFPARKQGRCFIIGTVARLSADKRLDQFIEAFRLALPRLPKCRLRIAGGPDGGNSEHARALRKLARGLPIEWLGDVRDVPAFLGKLDLFAMISEPAGCPNASLEAMASGLAVVATDHGGAREQVIDGVTGRLVPRGDVAAFADALVQLANDAPLRAQLAANARAHVQREFSMERMISGYTALIGGDPASIADSVRPRTLAPVAPLHQNGTRPNKHAARVQ